MAAGGFLLPLLSEAQAWGGAPRARARSSQRPTVAVMGGRTGRGGDGDGKAAGTDPNGAPGLSPPAPAALPVPNGAAAARPRHAEGAP